MQNPDIPLGIAWLLIVNTQFVFNIPNNSLSKLCPVEGY